MGKLTRFSANRTEQEMRDIFNQRIQDAKEVHDKFHANFITRDCPFCGSSNYKEIEKFADTYGVSQCNRCQSSFVNPCPNEEALEYYYNECDCNKMLQDVYRKRSKKSHFQVDSRALKIEQLINQNFKEQNIINILEVGCGVGTTLKKIKDHLSEVFPSKNFAYTGIDIDSNATGNPVDPDLNLHTANVESFVKTCDQKFDIVIHFELIEHLIDPYGFITNLKKLTSPNGLHYFTTPNNNSLEMQVGYNEFRALAHAIYPPMHLNAFSTSNINLFAYRSQLDLVEMNTPGKLDVDIINVTKDLKNETLKKLQRLSEDEQVVIQEIVQQNGISGHMSVVLMNSQS